MARTRRDPSQHQKQNSGRERRMIVVQSNRSLFHPNSGEKRTAGWRMALKRYTKASLPGGAPRARNVENSQTGRRRSTQKPSGLRHRVPDFRWTNAISEAEWKIYRKAINVLRSSGVPFMLGGGFALATFTGRWRDTKDIDFYIRPDDRKKVVAALARGGFFDYYPQRAYDRNWIYRSVRQGVIVDIIWAMANQRGQVDEQWFARRSPVEVRGERLEVVPMEEFLWCKLYIMQRDHCDWTDIFNLVYANGEHIDWPHVIDRLEEDTPLLRAMLEIFTWLCPKKARELPASLWKRLKMDDPAKRRLARGRDHIPLLDSRAWFAALQPTDRKLEV